MILVCSKTWVRRYRALDSVATDSKAAGPLLLQIAFWNLIRRKLPSENRAPAKPALYFQRNRTAVDAE
jgi:hypothetical protein